MVQKARPHINFFDSPCLSEIAQTLDAEMKRLRASRLGVVVKKAEPIGIEEEESMWSSGALGNHNPQTLLQTVFYLKGIHFALRSGSEHRCLRHHKSQIQLVSFRKPTKEGSSIRRFHLR